MNSVIQQYLNTIAYSTGFDVNDITSMDFLKSLINAGIADMQNSGVSDNVILTNDLVLTTLIIFVTDNINMNPGEFKSSPLYINNIVKLRMKSYGS